VGLPTGKTKASVPIGHNNWVRLRFADFIGLYISKKLLGPALMFWVFIAYDCGLRNVLFAASNDEEGRSHSSYPAFANAG
jgi:hypothetical protein